MSPKPEPSRLAFVYSPDAVVGAGAATPAIAGVAPGADLELKPLVEQELQQNPVLEEMASEELDLRDQSERDSDEAAASPDPAEPPEDLRADAVRKRGRRAGGRFSSGI